MITSLPAVQAFASHVFRYTCGGSHGGHSTDKRNANRRYRRTLNRITRRLQHNPETFDSEGFNTPSLSSWHLW